VQNIYRSNRLRNSNYIKHLNRIITGIFLVTAPLFFSGKVIAQQDPMYTQYMENLMTINPAYVGSKDLLSLMVVSRDQWVTMADAPVTRSIAMHSPVNNTNMGLGLSLLHDKIGPVKQTGVYFDYSYTLRFNNQHNLGLGLKAGVNFYDASLNDLLTNDPDDPVFASDINRNFLPNFGVGAFYYTNRYYLGLSIPKLIKNTINKNGFAVDHVNKEEIHLFLMGGYVLDVNRIVKFKPSFLYRYVSNAPLSFDLNGTFMFYDRLWLGAMYRLGESFGALFQIQATNQLKIDLPISKLGAYNKGTHEIMLSFDFNFNRGRVRSPRYF